MKKLGIICMILLFSLGTVGMGYAGWYDVILTKYTATTGIVSAGIRNHGANDHGPDPCSHGSADWKDQDIGYTHCEDGPYEYELEGKFYSDNVMVDIYGYQSYAPVCTLEMANCGSIPIKVDQIVIDWDGDLAENIQVGKWSVDCPDGYRKKGHGFNSLEDTIRYLCLDPGQKMWLDLEFRVGEKNGWKYTLGAINETLGEALKPKTAEAVTKIYKVSSDNDETNSTEPSTDVPDGQSDDKSTGGEATPDVPDTLPEEQVSKAIGGSSGAEIYVAPEMECGSATGTITITYRRWNEQWW